MTDCMENLGRLIRNSPGDLRTRALQAVAGLLALQVCLRSCFGIVVKASASRVADRGFSYHLRRDFPGVESHQ